MLYAIVNQSTNLVINVIELENDSIWSPPSGCIQIQNNTAKIGQIYSNGQFLTPATPALTVQQQIDGLRTQLQALDVYIPRGLEDMWETSNFKITTLPAIQQTRLTQKKSLRAQIAALTNSN